MNLADFPAEKIKVGLRLKSCLGTPGEITLYDPSKVDHDDWGPGLIEIKWENGRVSKGSQNYLGQVTVDPNHL